MKGEDISNNANTGFDRNLAGWVGGVGPLLVLAIHLLQSHSNDEADQEAYGAQHFFLEV